MEKEQSPIKLLITVVVIVLFGMWLQPHGSGPDCESEYSNMGDGC